jgi:hypothetical protein
MVFPGVTWFTKNIPVLCGRDCSAGIKKGYGLDGRGSIPCRGNIFLYTTVSSKPGWRSRYVVTNYLLDDREIGVRVLVGSRIFLFSTSSRPSLGPTQLPIQWVPGTLSSWIKRPEHEADHSPPTCAEVKETWSIHPLLHAPSWRSA